MIQRRTNYQQKKAFSNKPPRVMSDRYLRDELDALVRKILHKLESVCFTCGTTKNLQVGHLFERRHRHTRWDTSPEGNNHLQCENCNSRHEAKPEIYRDKFLMRFGERAYDEVATRAHSNQKLGYNDLIEIYESLKQQWEELKKRAA